MHNSFAPSAAALAACVAAAHAGTFGTVIDIGTGKPGGDSITGSIGSDTQLNLYDGGSVAPHFDIGPDDGTGFNTELNMYGGDAGFHLNAHRGSTLNVHHGTLGYHFDAFDGSTVNIAGGSVGSHFEAWAGSAVNIRGGLVDRFFDALTGSVVNISGGTIGGYFTAEAGSTVQISGGAVGELFHADGGSLVTVTGGAIGPSFRAYDGSLVRLAGGTYGDFFRADAGSTVELIGSSFTLDGVALDGLVTGEAFTINQRDGALLAGVFADGTAFEFELNGQLYNGDVFDAGATLLVTLVPAPTTLAALPALLITAARRRG